MSRARERVRIERPRFYSDGGGRAKTALRPIYGADKVTRLAVGLMRKYQARMNGFVFMESNGRPALVITDGSAIHSLMSLESDGTRIKQIYVMRNPEKLTRVAAAIGATTH